MKRKRRKSDVVVMVSSFLTEV